MLAELERWQLPHVQLVGDFQVLQVEHALDLDGHALALFIDAGTGTPARSSSAKPGCRPAARSALHALAPGGGAAEVFADIRGVTPPPPGFHCCRAR